LGTNRRTAFIYLLTGIFFTYVAIVSVESHIWNPTTLILIGVATLSFGAGFRRYINLYQNNNKEDE